MTKSESIKTAALQYIVDNNDEYAFRDLARAALEAAAKAEAEDRARSCPRCGALTGFGHHGNCK